MTLNQGQGHPNWYQNVELSGLYHHTKFERNWSVNVWIQAYVRLKIFFLYSAWGFSPLLFADLVTPEKVKVTETHKNW